MAPHLVRAQSAYKHIRILSFHHTHIHALLVMGWYNEKKTTHQYVVRFSCQIICATYKHSNPSRCV